MEVPIDLEKVGKKEKAHIVELYHQWEKSGE